MDFLYPDQKSCYGKQYEFFCTVMDKRDVDKKAWGSVKSGKIDFPIEPTRNMMIETKKAPVMSDIFIPKAYRDFPHLLKRRMPERMSDESIHRPPTKKLYDQSRQRKNFKTPEPMMELEKPVKHPENDPLSGNKRIPIPESIINPKAIDNPIDIYNKDDGLHPVSNQPLPILKTEQPKSKGVLDKLSEWWNRELPPTPNPIFKNKPFEKRKDYWGDVGSTALKEVGLYGGALGGEAYYEAPVDYMPAEPHFGPDPRFNTGPGPRLTGPDPNPESEPLWDNSAGREMLGRNLQPSKNVSKPTPGTMADRFSKVAEMYSSLKPGETFKAPEPSLVPGVTTGLTYDQIKQAKTESLPSFITNPDILSPPGAPSLEERVAAQAKVQAQKDYELQLKRDAMAEQKLGTTYATGWTFQKPTTTAGVKQTVQNIPVPVQSENIFSGSNYGSAFDRAAQKYYETKNTTSTTKPTTNTTTSNSSTSNITSTDAAIAAATAKFRSGLSYVSNSSPWG